MNSSPASTITIRKRRRIIAQSFCLALLLIYSFTWSQRILAGGAIGRDSDFLATYTAARLVNAGYGQALYDLTTQTRFQHAIVRLHVPPADLLPFIHPPFFVLPFLPLGILPYTWAFVAMLAVNLALLLVTLRLLVTHLSGLATIGRVTLLLACLSFFPCFVNLIQGQNALVTLLILTAAFGLLKQKQDGAAGVVLALGLYKPQLMLVFVLILLGKQRRRAVAAFCVMAILLVALSYSIVGWRGFSDYIRLTITESPLVDGAYGVNYPQMHNWRGLCRLWFGPHRSREINTLTILASIITLLPLVWSWRGPWQPGGAKFDLQFASTIVATLLVSPHLNTHDLTLWILAGALALNQARSRSKRRIVEGLIVAGSLISFLSLPLNQVLPLQLTTVFMAIVATLLCAAIERDHSPAR
jgi:hypothetical protein